MAKKKKTQLKPVARGFATTSVPKKPVEENKEATAPAPPESDVEGTEHSTSSRQVAQSEPSQSAPANPEETSLQCLVDKFQDKTEKEIVRTLKVNAYVAPMYDT